MFDDLIGVFEGSCIGSVILLLLTELSTSLLASDDVAGGVGGGSGAAADCRRGSVLTLIDGDFVIAGNRISSISQ